MAIWQGLVTVDSVESVYRINEHDNGTFEVETVYQDRWIRVCDDTYIINVLWHALKEFKRDALTNRML